MKPKKPQGKPSSKTTRPSRRKTEGTGRPRDVGPWSAASPAVSIERDATNRVVMVRHPTNPFRPEHVPGLPPDVDWEKPAGKELRTIAHAYIQSVSKTYKILPENWLAGLGANERNDSHPVRWLPLQPEGRRTPPCVHWRDRYASAGSQEPNEHIDRTAALLAGFVVEEKGVVIPLLGGQGISVIAHLDRINGKRAKVRITGMFNTLPQASQDTTGLLTDLLKRLVTWQRIRKDFADDAMREFGLDAGILSIAEAGIRIPQELFEKREPKRNQEKRKTYFDYLAKTTVLPGAGSAARSEEVALALVGRIWDWPSPHGKNYTFAPAMKRPLSAHATTTKAGVYRRDPFSSVGPDAYRRLRPNRSGLQLDTVKEDVEFPEFRTSPGPVALEMKDQGGRLLFRVTRSPFVDRIDESYWMDTQSLEVKLKNGAPRIDAGVRTNEFAAINAYLRARDFFERLVGYGFPPHEYFKSVELPLLVRYRAGINPGATNGWTTNAQVRFRPKPQLDDIQPAVVNPGGLEVRFALGDLDSSADSPLRPPETPRTPLGIASDPRWSWHEFCHVLLAAATGELEFPFAHSAGDAIAAILCDPQSELAPYPEWRHATFPWVEEPRRHDRDPARGWSWSGSLYQHEKFFAEPLSDRRGYWAEQILSTTLFRLYRAVGGDTERVTGVPDRPARQAAADYVVYLIMQALRLPGPASVVSLQTPEQFLFALQAADLGTSAIPSGIVAYPGGSVHKVVQWAFERQGLYAPDLDGPFDTDKDGIYLEDWRDKRDGTYTPISFLPNSQGNIGWHAPPGAVWVRRIADGMAPHQDPVKNQENFVYVNVRNKRKKSAAAVHVDVWVAALEAGKVPPFRDKVANGKEKWTHLGTRTVNVPKAAGKTNHGKKKVGSFKWSDPAAGDYALLVSASWAGDRSNLDPTGGAPCATSTAPLGLERVVACDDNLGLRVVRVS
jgi:hypothetical protein